jgi:hypothetical protein
VPGYKPVRTFAIGTWRLASTPHVVADYVFKSGSLVLRLGEGGVVWKLQVDRSAGEHDGGGFGLGTVETVGATDDQPNLVVVSLS